MNMMRPVTDDREAAMARADLYKLANYSMKLFKMIHDGQQLEGWVQAKITKAADYVASVYHFMEYEMKFSEYGKKIESADMYTESVKQEFKAKLTEAKAKLDKLKEKNIKDLDEGWEDMVKASKERAKEQGTGKFDKKKTSTGTVYTRKSSTFDDGGEDKDVKKAKKAKSVKEEAKKVDIPAYKRKEKGGDWKVTQKDLDKDDENNMSSKAGLAKRKKDLGMSETLKGGQKKLDVDKDGKLEKSDFAKLRASKKVKESEGKCNHTAEGKNCPVHGLKECGTMEGLSHAAKTTMKHVKNPTAGEKKAAKDIKPGVKGYKDRVDMLKSAEKDGRLKEGSKPDFLDMDKDGNKKEPMKKAVADKKKNPFVKK